MRIVFGLALERFTERPSNSAKAREFQEFIVTPLVGRRTTELLGVGLGPLREDWRYNL